MKIKIGLSAVILMFFLNITGAFAAIDQTYAERIIKENRGFIEFINECTSNFAGDKKEELLQIYQKHFNAEVAFLQGEYKRAFDNVYDSQKDMVALYEYMLTSHYLEDSKNILDNLAPEIIRSKNSLARQYLTLGYRDRTVARTHYIVGDASHPRLYSYKIFKYEEGIKMCRRAKRYGFLSLYMGQKIEGKRKIFNNFFKTENMNGSPFFSRFVDKNEADYIKEMNITYAEFEKRSQVKASESVNAEKGDKTAVSGKEVFFEKKVARRVRFRKEQRLAVYLLNGEFDKGEPIMRSYIDNYNYKLMTATLKTLPFKQDEHREEGVKGEGNYNRYIKHHKDNYSLIAGESLLDSLSGSVRVLDSVKKKDEKAYIEGEDGIIEKEASKSETKPVKDEKKETVK